MKFEVINDKNKTVMLTEYISCIPNNSALTSMFDAGYRFKIDGKIIPIKKLKEKLKEFNSGEYNQD